jgi:hypothetical protein
MDLQLMLSLSYMHFGQVSFIFLIEFLTRAESEAGMARPAQSKNRYLDAPTGGGAGNRRREWGTQHF